MLVDPLLKHFFFIFCRKLKEKVVLASKKQKQMILTSERRAEHLFAGRNTQQRIAFSNKAYKNAKKMTLQKTNI